MSEKDTAIPAARIIMFSDAVIAIIITLMVLTIKVPTVNKSDEAAIVWQKLSEMLGPGKSYVLSFVMIGVLWVNHHQFFIQLKYINRHILWLNLHLLFWLSLIPIPTDLLGKNFLRPELTACYGFVMFMCLFAFLLMRRYAQRANLFIDSISPQMIRHRKRKLQISVILCFISIFAGYLSEYLSLAIFVSVGLVYFIPSPVETKA